MANKRLAKRIYKLQNRLVRELNDAHIFLEQARPLLTEAKSRFERSSTADRRYYVPSVTPRRAFAQRTDAELREIYDRYLTRGLFEAFLVSSIAGFEAFVGDVLYQFLLEYPLRLGEKVVGVPKCSDIPAVDLARAPDKEQLLTRVIDEHVSNVLRQRPSLYMGYLVNIVGVKNDASFRDFYEVAATRDLLVHNSSIVNSLYLEKAGSKARGLEGESVVVDQDYLYGSLGILKRVSGAIKRDVEEKFGGAGADA